MRKLFLVTLLLFGVATLYAGDSTLTGRESYVKSWETLDGGIDYKVTLPCTSSADSFTTWAFDISTYKSVSFGIQTDTGSVWTDGTHCCSLFASWEQSFDGLTFARPFGYTCVIDSPYTDTTEALTIKQLAPADVDWMRFKIYPQADTHALPNSGRIIIYIRLSKSPISFRSGGGKGGATMGGGVKLAGKVYTGTPDADWLAPRYDLLIGDSDLDEATHSMKAQNPDLKLFRYCGTATVTDESGSGHRVYMPGLPSEPSHPEWLWYDGEAAYIKASTHRWYVMPDSAAWHPFWVSGVLSMTDGYPYDGVKGDVCPLDIEEYENFDTTVIPWNVDSLKSRYKAEFGSFAEQDFHADQEPHVAWIHDSLNAEGLLLIVNNFGIYSRVDTSDYGGAYFENTRRGHIDGLSHQYFPVTVSGYQPLPGIEDRAAIFDNTSALGKILVLFSRPDTTGVLTREHILYSIGWHLLLRNDPYVYLGFDWGGQGGEYADRQLIYRDYGNLFSVNYGDPVGPRYKRGGMWSRIYTNGIATVDPANYTFVFQWF